MTVRQAALRVMAATFSVSTLIVLWQSQTIASSPVAKAEHEYALGNYDKVLALTDGKHDVPSLILQARAHRWKDGATDPYCDEAVRLAPKDSTALTWRGYCSLDRRFYKDAEPWLRRALQANPKNSDALAMLGYCQVKQGKPGEGLALLNQALSLNPGSEIGLEYMAQAAESQSDLKGAEKYYNRIIQLFPSMPRPWELKGQLYEHTGSLKEATECYRKALTINPRFESACTHLANIKLDQKLYPDSVTAATNCIHLHSLSSEYYKCLRIRARAYENLHQLKLAVTDWEVKVSKDTKDAAGAHSHGQDEALLSIARDQRSLKNYPQALVAITRLLKIRPASREPRFEQARILEEMACNDCLDRAVVIYSRLISEDNTVAEWYQARARALHRMGKTAAAVADEKMAKSLEE